jgi:hypothetical protein
MDNVQNCDSYIHVPSSQTHRNNVSVCSVYRWQEQNTKLLILSTTNGHWFAVKERYNVLKHFNFENYDNKIMKRG